MLKIMINYVEDFKKGILSISTPRIIKIFKARDPFNTIFIKTQDSSQILSSCFYCIEPRIIFCFFIGAQELHIPEFPNNRRHQVQLDIIYRLEG